MSKVYREGPWKIREHSHTYNRMLMECPLCGYEFSEGESRVEHFHTGHEPQDLVAAEGVRDRCELCEREPGEHRLDISSGSGVIPVDTCKECENWAIETIRESVNGECAICGGDTSDKYSIFGYGEPNGPESRICYDCRNTIAFSDAPIREVVVE